MNSMEALKREQDERARQAVASVFSMRWEVRDGKSMAKIYLRNAPDSARALFMVPKRTGREHITERLARSIARMPELLAACERMVKLLDPDEPLPSLEEDGADELLPGYKKLIADIRGGAHAEEA